MSPLSYFGHNHGTDVCKWVLISPYPDQEGNKLHSPNFMDLGGSLPHSQESTTCPYPRQVNPFLCSSHFRQAKLVSFLVGLRTYQHPVTFTGETEDNVPLWISFEPAGKFSCSYERHGS